MDAQQAINALSALKTEKETEAAAVSAAYSYLVDELTPDLTQLQVMADARDAAIAESTALRQQLESAQIELAAYKAKIAALVDTYTTLNPIALIDSTTANLASAKTTIETLAETFRQLQA